MEYLEYLQFLIPIIGIVFIGWVSGLSPYTHNKKLIIQIIIFLLATGYTFITHDSHEWIHFVKKETLPSIAMVLGITGILVFNFTIIPKNQTSLFILLGFITPILSNIGTSLMVLPILIGSTPYLFRKYGKMKGLLILIIVSMMAANTLAVFTAQADLPTTAYVSDMKLGEEYTQGKSPFEVLRPVGLFAFMAYIVILFIVGVKPKLNELTQISFKIEGKSSFLISIVLSALFIIIMNINIWYYYLLAPIAAFALAKVQAFKKEKIGENNIHELKTVYIETIILFISIFSLIQCIPFTIVEGNKFMIVAATIIETMSSDNLIAFQANKYLGYGISWDFGTQWVLLSSILYGAHFIMGHIVLIFFFLNFLPKNWEKIIINEEEMEEISEFRDISLNKKETKYEKIILKKFMLVSFALLPLTVGLQLSVSEGVPVILLGGLLSFVFIYNLKDKFK